MQGTKYNFIVLFQIVGYFAEPLISRETLQRNSVMQKSCAGDQVNGTSELTKNLIPFYQLMALALSCIQIRARY